MVCTCTCVLVWPGVDRIYTVCMYTYEISTIHKLSKRNVIHPFSSPSHLTYLPSLLPSHTLPPTLSLPGVPMRPNRTISTSSSQLEKVDEDGTATPTPSGSGEEKLYVFPVSNSVIDLVVMLTRTACFTGTTLEVLSSKMRLGVSRLEREKVWGGGGGGRGDG